MSITSLEQKLFTRDDAGFKAQLFELLDSIERGAPVLGGERQGKQGQVFRSDGIPPLHINASFFNNQNLTHRLATCITGFLCSPVLELTHTDIHKLLIYKTHLTDIFYVSDFGNMDHIVTYRGLWSEHSGFQLNNDADVLMLLICWTLNSKISPPFEILLDKKPQDLLHMLTAALYQMEQVQTTQGFDNFQLAFNTFLELPEGLDVSSCLVMLINIWMGCSYWDFPRRHEIKKKINALIRHHFNAFIDDTPKPMPETPRVAILIEKYRSDHAVYRCYHSRISELKKKFVTALFYAPGDTDEISRKDAHQAVQIPSAVGEFEKAIKTIKKFKPDIILYPSLGMNVWTVCLANFRIAPMQTMGYGHPASAMSSTLDYGFLSGFLEGPDYQSFCTETLIPAYGEIGNITLHPDLDESQRSETLTTDCNEVRIAINSSLMKISDRVLATCKMLIENSSVPIKFHFFPAHNRGFKLQAFHRKLLHAIGDNIVVHEPKPYKHYMKSLGHCHFAIGTFPFGGTNTNIDSILLEQPKVYLLQEQDLASFTDGNDFKRYDTEAGFFCSSELELIAKAITWAHNPFELEEAKSRVGEMRKTLKAIIEKSENHPLSTSFSEGILAIQKTKKAI